MDILIYTAEMMDRKLGEAGELVDLLKKTVLELDDGVVSLQIQADSVDARAVIDSYKPLRLGTIKIL